MSGLDLIDLDDDDTCKQCKPCTLNAIAEKPSAVTVRSDVASYICYKEEMNRQRIMELLRHPLVKIKVDKKGNIKYIIKKEDLDQLIKDL